MVFAAQPEDSHTFKNTVRTTLAVENSDYRSGSYTYVDLGTVTKKFSSDEVIASVSVLSRVLTMGSNVPTKMARALANKLFKKISGYKEKTLYYTAEIHTTQVFLDGEFVYYIIDDETSVYSDAKRKNLIGRESCSGESVSPALALKDLATNLGMRITPSSLNW